MLHILLFSKIPMSNTEFFFAKQDLTKAVRFAAALKITSQHFLHKKFDAPVILFALMCAIEEYAKFNMRTVRMSTLKKNTIGNRSFSSKTNKEVAEFFVNVYYDDELLLGWLNNKLTERTVGMAMKEVEKSNAVDIAKQIINEDLLANLDLSF